MKDNKIRDISEFNLWVKIRMLEKGVSQRQLAEQMNTHHARISEAITGKPSGNKYIVPIIEELGGNKEDFKEFLKETSII